MTELDIKTLQAMVQIAQPTSSTDIGEITGELPLNVGRRLRHLAKGGLAGQTDKKANLWNISEKGEAALEEVLSQQSLTREATGDTTGEATDKVIAVVTDKGTGEPKPPETTVTFPSQSDLFKKEGELLGVGGKKGEIQLDTIVKWVERTANLDDLSSVWNALAEMNVASNVRKRWIKLYAQNLPGKEIPADLKEKLEAGMESDKVGVAEKGDIVPKPTRFSIINDLIIGDTEGDFTFKEALQLFAQQKGVPAAQADPLAGIVEAMKVGPDMATTVLTSLIPLIQKEPAGKDDNVLLQILQANQASSQAQMETLRTMILTLSEDKHKAEMESLRAEIRTGQKSSESDPRIEALSASVQALTQSLHEKEIESVKEQNQRNVDVLQGDVKRLEQQITAVAQGKKLEGSLGLMEHALDTVSGQLSGIRSDVKPLVETILKSGSPLIPPRSPEDKARLAKVGKEVIAKATRAEELEHKILSL